MTLTTTISPSEQVMRISDEQLEKLGEFYTSEYVTLNQPWIRERTFAQWVEARIMSKNDEVISF